MEQRAEREVAAAPRTAPVPCAQSDGLAIYRFGQGEPILFMPYPHAASMVGDPTPTAIIEGLEQADRQVITFDPPGAVRSTRPARLDLAEMLDSAEEALQNCGVNEPVDVVGHSQGAFADLVFAIERPQRVRRLILVGASAGGPSFFRAPGAIWNRSHPAHWHWVLWASVYQLTRRLAAQKLMMNVVSQASWVERSRAPQQHVSLRDWFRPAQPRLQWGQVVRRLDYRQRLGEVRVPTLLLTGLHDPQTPVVCAQELAARIPNARLVLFEQSGHNPFLEEPGAFWEAVRAFLLEGIGANSGDHRRPSRI
jgi:pimeloyl-ACP methyl ester carboxylesterase